MTIKFNPYTSIGGFKCRMEFNIEVRKWTDFHEKKVGYFKEWYDGYYHFFAVYPLVIKWYYLPEIID